MAAQREQFSFTGRDGARITGYRWAPDGPPKGVVQLAHGMGEHVRRYEELAQRLAGRGWLVAGPDHRGHGATAETVAAAYGDVGEALGQLGAEGWVELVNDIHELATVLGAENPGVPVVLVGHSMGSFAAQQFVLDHSADIEALVLSGTAAIDLLEPALDLEQPMDLTAFNAAFQPQRTDYDWLSRDEAQVDRYVEDPFCGFGLDPDAAKSMFAGARPLADPERVAQIRPGLPILIAVGEDDPVNGNLALVHPLVERLRNEGLQVDLKTYPGARHEIFNETNRDEITALVINWLDAHPS